MFSSAHTPLEVMIDCKVSVSNKVEKAPLPPAPRIKWDPYKAELLKAEIASSTNKEKLATINDNLSKAANTNEIDRYAKNMFFYSVQILQIQNHRNLHFSTFVCITFEVHMHSI